MREKKFTVNKKREFIRRFIAGEEAVRLVQEFMPYGGMITWGYESIFRSYMRGEFTLKPKKRGLK